MKKQLLILMTLCTAVIGYSQTFNAPDNNNNILEYDITTTTTVEVRDYISGGTDINIPSTVDNPNDGMTYNVTTIGNSAFQANNLTSATIPDGVTNIGNLAFFQNNLTSITIPNSVTMIGSSAFVSNPLTCVISEGTNPATVFTPTPGAGSTASDSFSTNRTSVNLTIPTGTAAAYTSAQWTGFNSVSEGLNNTFVVDHITYQVNTSTTNEVTITDYNTAGGTIVNIPATVTSSCTDFSVAAVGVSAFQSNNLTSVTIPDSVTSIGTAAFLTNNLTSVIIPDNVITIGDGAFAQNYNLANVVLGSNVTTIGDATFRYASFASITIPASVTSIGHLTFGDITELADVTSLATTPPTIITGTNDTFTNSSFRGSINLHIPPNTTGVYVTDSGALWTGFNSVTQDALGVSDFALNNNVNIITANNQISVTYNNNIRLKKYSIYSITGAKVKEGTESTVNIEALSNGVYLLKLDFNTGTVVKKIAK